jgi:hypothetical protein
MSFKEYLAEAGLTDKQLAVYEKIKKEINKLKFGKGTSYHGLKGNVLRVTVTILMLTSKEERQKVVDIMKKHKLKNVRQLPSAGARGAGVMFDGTDK